jgi:hypothetical protein
MGKRRAQGVCASRHDQTERICRKERDAGRALGARSPLSFLVLHHLHGAGIRVAPETTAFGMRRKHFMLEIGAAWEPSSKAEGDVHREWAHRLSRAALAPFALPGGYANFLTPEDHEQIGSVYGGNAGRLREVKRRFDPDNVFPQRYPPRLLIHLPVH